MLPHTTLNIEYINIIYVDAYKTFWKKSHTQNPNYWKHSYKIDVFPKTSSKRHIFTKIIKHHFRHHRNTGKWCYKSASGTPGTRSSWTTRRSVRHLAAGRRRRRLVSMRTSAEFLLSALLTLTDTGSGTLPVTRHRVTTCSKKKRSK